MTARKNPHAVALGRKGGKVTSEAKAAAARLNARKGGWPKGKPRPKQSTAARENGKKGGRPLKRKKAEDE